MREVFLKVQYVICWAGCNVPLEERIFDRWSDALLCYNKYLGNLSLRIEEITTKRVVKIVFPEAGK